MEAKAKLLTVIEIYNECNVGANPELVRANVQGIRGLRQARSGSFSIAGSMSKRSLDLDRKAYGNRSSVVAQDHYRRLHHVQGRK